MSETTEAVQLAFTKLGELASTYGPPAIDTAARVVTVNSIGSIMIGATGLVVALVAALVMRGHIARVKKALGDSFEYYDVEPFLIIIPGAVLVFGIGAAAVNLLDVWNWVALWDPKLALAAKVISALPGV